MNLYGLHPIDLETSSQQRIIAGTLIIFFVRELQKDSGVLLVTYNDPRVLQVKHDDPRVV
jgi:hypothetical protein